MNYSSALKNPVFRTVQLASDELSYPTYVVGGWVRDLLINRLQTKTDIDFVCIGSGIKFAEQLSKKLGKEATFKVFKNFGTAMIVLELNSALLIKRKKTINLYRDKKNP